MIVIFPFVLMGMVEYLERGSYKELHQWVTTHPFTMVLAYFVVGTLYLFLIALPVEGDFPFGCYLPFCYLLERLAAVN